MDSRDDRPPTYDGKDSIYHLYIIIKTLRPLSPLFPINMSTSFFNSAYNKYLVLTAKLKI